MSAATTRKISLKELAAMWGVKVSAIRTEVRSGRLYAIRIGARLYFDESDIEEWLERQRNRDRALTAAAKPLASPDFSREQECERLGIQAHHQFR
jgi:excisionase family DNA binding protein